MTRLIVGDISVANPNRAVSGFAGRLIWKIRESVTKILAQHLLSLGRVQNVC